ncbi:MAG TPA: hypothetical protein VGH94_07200 [Acidimicrobiales bacterium]|jgi:hypothetical protein
MADDIWTHATLELDQPGWPGIKKAEWLASTVEGELFRSRELLPALDRLGADGWELAAFAPEFNDRCATYVFKRRSQPAP